MTVELLSRFQFAFTVMFHMTFPAVTVGLAIFSAITYGFYWRTGRAVYLQMFRFWRRIFGVGFALGVVTGAVLTFQFGLNWGGYAHAVGPIIGPIIAMEVVTGFFVEAGFIGVLLYGDGRVSPRTMFWSTCVVALGTVISTTWIIAANSWMQTPAGFSTDAQGRFVAENWWEIIFTVAFAWRFPHMLLAVLISASLFIAGISAVYLLRGRARGFAKRSFSFGVGLIAIVIPFQLMIGDNIAGNVLAPYQAPKIQSLEGNWDSTNTGYNIFVIPDMAEQKNLVQVTIPLLGSYISKDLSGKTPTPGLSETPKDLQPNMWTTFWGFRVMFFASMFIFAGAMMGVILRMRRRLDTARWYHKYMLWVTPVGILAILGGWVLAETGRQPWVVYGQLRTADAVSGLATPQMVFSLSTFVALYLTMLTVYIVYVVRTVRTGPERDDPRRRPDAPDGIEPAGHRELVGDRSGS